jgi:hypothetical protein
MIKFLTLVLLLLSQILSAQVAQVERSEYYADFTFWESPYLPFRGAYPVSKEKTAERIHLQLDYDANNRVIAAHVKLGQHYKEFEGANGSMAYNAPLTKITYTDSTEIHTFYDRFGYQTSIMGNVFKKVYKKDRYGRNIQLTFLNKENARTTNWFDYEIYEWEHLLDGSIIETRKNKDGEVSPLRGGFQFKITKMLAGADGYFNTLMNIDDNGNLINAECGAAILKYYYDQQGRFLKWEVFDKDGKPAIGPSNTAGEYNTFHKYKLSDIIFYDTLKNPAVHWSGAERWHHEVDKFGNSVTREFQKRDKSLMNGYNGYAKAEFEYSDDGRFLLAHRLYDSENKRVNHKVLGIHEIIYKRDDDGRIIEQEYRGIDGLLKNRMDNGIARITINYNEKTNASKSTSYDKDGNIIN